MHSLSARRGSAFRRAVAVIGTCAAVVAASLATSVPALAATASTSTSGAAAPTTSRLQGVDRYDTAVQVAKAGYPTGAGVVFLASGADFPDALAAGPAAAKLGGPLLLTETNALPASVSAELTALAPSKVYLVGGTSVEGGGVASAVSKALPNATVTRLQGADRYATGRQVASVFGTASTAFIATGANFADALSAAAAAGSEGAPVVLVNGSSPALDAATVAELHTLGVTDAVIAGGTAVVSTGIQNGLDSLLGGAAHVSRYGGANRYATSALIGQKFFPTATTAYFASGVDFPDALPASALAGAQHAPLFTVEPGCVPNQTGAVVRSIGVSHVVLVGGAHALSANVASLTPCEASFTASPTPTISGRAEVGQALTVNPGSWSPAPATLTFQWSKAASGSSTYANISGATSARYTVPSGDAGDTFRVTVVATKSGYVTTSRTSPATAAATPGPMLSVVAGIGYAPIPGPALKSPLLPQAVAADSSGNLYVVDVGGNLVEKVSAAGTLSIVAGNGDSDRPVAGPATHSPLEGVTGVAVDSSGNLYLADQEYVEKVTPSGTLSILAGNGGSVTHPVAGPARNSVVAPVAVAVDASGNVYIADQNEYIEKVTPSGTLSVIAGNGASGAPKPGTATASPLGSFTGIAVDGQGNVYVAESLYSVVQMITPAGILSIVAGGGKSAVNGGPATNASLSPGALAVDSAGDLFIADGGTFNYVGYGGLGGGGSSNGSNGGYVDEMTPSGALSIVAGTIKAGATTAGPALASGMQPSGLAFDGAGNLVIGDDNGYLDEVSPTGTLSIVAGIGFAPIPGPATSSPIEPASVAVDQSGNLYVADPGNGLVEKVTPSGTLSIVAGSSGGVYPPVAGPATAVSLAPDGVAVDASGNLYIADGNGFVEKVTPDGMLSIVAGNGGDDGHPTPGPVAGSTVAPTAVTVDGAGNVYIADQNYYVEKVTPAGMLSIVAGNGTDSGPTPGAATASPLGAVTSMAVDHAGNLYLADGENSAVEKVTPAGKLSIVAGGSLQWTSTGPATGTLIAPTAVAVDSSGTLYVADLMGFVYKVSSTGALSVAAGSASQTPSAPSVTPGLARNIGISPWALAAGPSGTLYIGDSSGYIEEVTP